MKNLITTVIFVVLSLVSFGQKELIGSYSTEERKIVISTIDSNIVYGKIIENEMEGSFTGIISENHFFELGDRDDSDPEVLLILCCSHQYEMIMSVEYPWSEYPTHMIAYFGLVFQPDENGEATTKIKERSFNYIERVGNEY